MVYCGWYLYLGFDNKQAREIITKKTDAPDIPKEIKMLHYMCYMRRLLIIMINIFYDKAAADP